MVVNNNNLISAFHCPDANEATSKSDPACSRKQGEAYGSLWKVFSCSWFCSLILPWSRQRCPCHLVPAYPSKMTSASRCHLHNPQSGRWSKGPECLCAPVLHPERENAHHTGTISKSLFVTLARSCVSKRPLFPPATLSAHRTLSGVQVYSPKSWFFPFLPASSFPFSLYMKTPGLIFF